MKYLKKFENFEAQDEVEKLHPTGYDMELNSEEEMEEYDMAQEDEEEESSENEEGHEEVTLEKKKLPAGLKAYLDKKKKSGAKKTTSKAKPDFLDLDKDGDKKESMKKAAKEAKAKKK